MTKANVSVESGEALFVPGQLELSSAGLDAEITTNEFQLDSSASSIFAFHGELRAVTKTMGPFTGQLFIGSGQQIATLDNVTVTATRGTSPDGQSFVLITLECLVTSLGWRTGAGGPPGSGSEPFGASQEIRFQNSAGGTMYVCTPGPFEMRCGDQRRYARSMYAERYFLGWFDQWARVTHFVQGSFFRC